MDAEKVMVGCEPTGHYWFNFAQYVKQSGMTLVLVNTYHVKQTKELDDNSPTKNDSKDPKRIAKLVSEGRYASSSGTHLWASRTKELRTPP